jgi:ABC-type antimicrobial peptide transport system permease subunit
LISGARISEPVTLGTRFDRIAQARQRFVSLLAAAAVTGGLLSACGAFVLISYSVKIRRREFAIRLAVGAGARNVVGLVFRYLAQVVSTAAVIGAVLALVALKVLESVIVASGALTAAGVGVIVSALLFIVGVAALTPALHAAHVQPSDALRID